MKTRTLLVDASYLLQRSYHGAKDTYTQSYGHIGALYSFLTTVRKMIKEHMINKAVLVWDGEGGGVQRYRIDNKYKANRKNKEWYKKIELSERDIKREKEKEDSIHIKAKINVSSSDGFGFIIRNGKKEMGTEIRYDVAKKMLECMGGRATVETKNGILQLEILVDRASIEIFANEGEAVLSSCFFPGENDKELTFWIQGGEVMVEEMEAYELKSAWKVK